MHSVHTADSSSPNDFDALVATIKGHATDPAAVTVTQIRRWHRTTEDHRHQSFARGYVIGRALKAQKKAVKHGETEAWAARVGISPQQINVYVRGFIAIERARLRFPPSQDALLL